MRELPRPEGWGLPAPSFAILQVNNFAKFCKSLRSKNGNVTRLELDKMVTSCLKGVGASQTPQLEGTRATMLEKVFT
ncbi:MAG: hypothetical protein PHY05_02160 [Methanothrix sp.]|nr:hypothetical protein [Methanothrix sp.]